MAQMWITMGPQHPMTHGLWTLRVKVDGETVVDTEAELGYIHRGVEKNRRSSRLHANHALLRPTLLRERHDLGKFLHLCRRRPA